MPTGYENGNQFYQLGTEYSNFVFFFIILPIENCIPMTKNALSIEAVGRRANL